MVQGQPGAVGWLAVAGALFLGDAVGVERLVQAVPAQQLAAQVEVCVARGRVVGDDVSEEPHPIGVQARVAPGQLAQPGQDQHHEHRTGCLTPLLVVPAEYGQPGRRRRD